jgi:hypothetical protein
MFGMLDYRAYKLLWLLRLPWRIVDWIAFFAAVVIAVLIAEWTQYPLLLKIVVGFVAFEAVGFLLFIILRIIGWPFQRMFFWMIDVVPARGANAEEARNIALHGKIIWLDKKLASDIENWSPEDTAELVSLLSWRARLFFNARERVEDRIDILRGHLEGTGRQINDMRADEIKALVGHLDFNWFETAIADRRFFYSIFAFVLVVGTLLYINQDINQVSPAAAIGLFAVASLIVFVVWQQAHPVFRSWVKIAAGVAAVGVVTGSFF